MRYSGRSVPCEVIPGLSWLIGRSAHAVTEATTVESAITPVLFASPLVTQAAIPASIRPGITQHTAAITLHRVVTTAMRVAILAHKVALPEQPRRQEQLQLHLLLPVILPQLL